MKLIFGLGNPGPKYEVTRHNAGFLILDMLAEKFGIAWTGKKFEAEVGKGDVFGEPCVLLKPQTFMNLSGRSVVSAIQFFKVKPEDIIVISDDVDLESGRVRARTGGGHGGQNGLRSIIAETGQDGFHRIKVGIGRPTNPQQDVSSWVLGQFTDEELLQLQEKCFTEVLARLENIVKQMKGSQK